MASDVEHILARTLAVYTPSFVTCAHMVTGILSESSEFSMHCWCESLASVLLFRSPGFPVYFIVVNLITRNFEFL